MHGLCEVSVVCVGMARGLGTGGSAGMEGGRGAGSIVLVQKVWLGAGGRRAAEAKDSRVLALIQLLWLSLAWVGKT